MIKLKNSEGQLLEMEDEAFISSLASHYEENASVIHFHSEEATADMFFPVDEVEEAKMGELQREARRRVLDAVR